MENDALLKELGTLCKLAQSNFNSANEEGAYYNLLEINELVAAKIFEMKTILGKTGKDTV